MIHGAYRDKSKSLGLWVYLCHFSCHQFGKYAAHNNIETDLMLKHDAQIAAMDYYGMSTEEFIEEFGKDYLWQKKESRMANVVSDPDLSVSKMSATLAVGTPKRKSVDTRLNLPK